MTVADFVLRPDLPGGRRALRLRLGPITIAAVEVPASSLSDPEWRDVQLARRSYAAVWGGGDESIILRDDPFDGRGKHARVWDVRHYLAWVRHTRSGDAPKLVTARKVAVRPASLTVAQRANPLDVLPLDVRFWRTRTEHGFEPLWQPLRANLRANAPGNRRLAEFRFATVGRFATYPLGERERERTAAGWAAIQILATYRDRNLLHLRTVRPDFADRVLAVPVPDAGIVAPAFPRAEDALGLSRGSVELDVRLGVVRQHQVDVPGYFVNGDDAAAALASLLETGRITIRDLHGAIARLTAGDSVRPGDLQRLPSVDGPGQLARLLTRPRSFKHLAPLISGTEPLERMSAEEFQRHIVHGPRAVPFCSAASPAVWAANAWRVLDAVARKCSATPARQLRGEA